MRWVIDEVQVVHLKHCEMVIEHATDYKATPTTPEEMVAHLARPEVANGHSAPSPLVPCDQCILDLPLNLGEVA